MRNESVKWRLRSGLLCAGLDRQLHCVLLAPDDPQVQIFDERDNEQAKAKFYGALLGCKFEIEIL